MLVLISLAVVWAVVLVPPFLRKRREGRPGSSVVSFRQQLSTLERATPGTSLSPLPTAPGTGVTGTSFSGTQVPGRMSRSQVVRRRRDVLVGLLGCTAFTFLLAVVAQGIFVVVFLASAGGLAAYGFALVQIRKAQAERTAKVRVLRPQIGSAPVVALRRTAAN